MIPVAVVDILIFILSISPIFLYLSVIFIVIKPMKKLTLETFTFQFIDGRLAKLNAGRGFSDIFEEEITAGGFSGGEDNFECGYPLSRHLIFMPVLEYEYPFFRQCLILCLFLSMSIHFLDI